MQNGSGVLGGIFSTNNSDIRDFGLTIQKTSYSEYAVHARPIIRRGPPFPLPGDVMRSQSIFKCVPVHFRDKGAGSGGSVALVSFPGSGNTWLRYLLQLSTGGCEGGGGDLCICFFMRISGSWVSIGIFTGSVYKDFALLRNGFPGESITDGRVLVVKTHESGPAARNHFQKAILLIRKPGEAILAEFNRRAAGHIGHAGKDKYTRNAGRCNKSPVINYHPKNRISFSFSLSRLVNLCRTKGEVMGGNESGLDPGLPGSSPDLHVQSTRPKYGGRTDQDPGLSGGTEKNKIRVIRQYIKWGWVM